MPSAIRFLVVVFLLAGLAYGGLYAAAVYLEPPQQDVRKPLPNLKIRRE